MLRGSGRSAEEIDEILTAAKLERKDLLPVSQEITFDENFSGTQFRLVELDKVIAEKIREGSRLVFRGEPNDSAVLCTEDATYEVKDTETSNSLLVLEELSFPEQARRTSGSTNSSGSSTSPDSLSSVPIISFESANGLKQPEDQKEDNNGDTLLEMETVVRPIKYIAHSYFELKKINPNLSKIRRILFSSKYKGENAENDTKDFMTLDDLLELMPASVKEIEGYLEAIRAIELNGFIRLIDEDYLFRVLSRVISCIDENSWSNDTIQKSELIKTLSGSEPRIILEKVCDWFFIPSPESSDGETLRYNEYQVCRFMGETLLKPVDRFNLREFIKVWQESVPEGLKVSMKQLEGIAVTNLQTSPACIWHFPEYNLPENTTDRFAVLFETKPKWKLEEITPFLQNISSTSHSVGILLTKFARVANTNGIKYYSSKHSK